MNAQLDMSYVIVVGIMASFLSAFVVVGLFRIWFRSRRKAEQGGDE